MRVPPLLLALAVALVACPKRGVIVDGRETTYEAASADASAELARLKAEKGRNPAELAQSAERLEALARRYGDVPASGEALYEASVRWRAAGRPDRARAALSRLLTEMPLSPRAPRAKLELAKAETDAGRPREALSSLSSLYDKLDPGDRPQAAREAARAAEAAQQWEPAARWRAEAARVGQGEDRSRDLARATEYLQTRLGAPDVSQLLRELPDDSPLLPAAGLRLAQLRLQAHDDDGAKRAAGDVVGHFPGTPAADEARAMLDRLARKGPLDVRAIGVAVPLSGKQKPWGEAILRGVALALGDDGKFKVVVKDTKGEPDASRAAVEELAFTNGAVAALGGVVNAEAPQAAAAAQQAGLPFVSLARVEGVTQAGPFVFRNMLTAEAQAKALAELAIQRRGLKRFGVLYPQIPYGQELAAAFWDEVERRGGEVRAAESYDHDRTTFAPIVKSMVGKLWLEERQDYVDAAKQITEGETNPYRRRKAVERLRDRLPPITDFDALFIPDFAKTLALVTPALAVEDVVTQTCDPREVERIARATGRDDVHAVQLLGANGWDDPALLERAGRYVECAVFVDGFFAASERPATKAFVAAFTAKYGHAPSILEASAYDSARLIRAALEAGAASRDAVRDRLATTRGFPGATGDLGFDARREVEKPLFYITVEKGAFRELTPKELGAPGAG